MLNLDIDIREGNSTRMDCPSCGGKNTLVATKRSGCVLYVCHRASCNVKGVLENQFTIEDLKPKANVTPINKFDPSTFVSTQLHTDVIKWIMDNNCHEWYHYNIGRIRYDPKQDRVVFLIEKDGQTVDAIGRYLGTEDKPKWYRYGNSGVPFVAETIAQIATAKKYRTCFIVEDAASACSIARLHSDGMALLGTTPTTTALLLAAEYQKVYIALDRDALDTTIKVSKMFNQIIDTEILVIDKDLKYYNKDEIFEYFKGLD